MKKMSPLSFGSPSLLQVQWVPLLAVSQLKTVALILGHQLSMAQSGNQQWIG